MFVRTLRPGPSSSSPVTQQGTPRAVLTPSHDLNPANHRKNHFGKVVRDELSYGVSIRIVEISTVPYPTKPTTTSVVFRPRHLIL
jgi:hypothetical protein